MSSLLARGEWEKDLTCIPRCLILIFGSVAPSVQTLHGTPGLSPVVYVTRTLNRKGAVPQAVLHAATSSKVHIWQYRRDTCSSPFYSDYWCCLSPYIAACSLILPQLHTRTYYGWYILQPQHLLIWHWQVLIRIVWISDTRQSRHTDITRSMLFGDDNSIVHIESYVRIIASRSQFWRVLKFRWWNIVRFRRCVMSDQRRMKFEAFGMSGTSACPWYITEPSRTSLAHLADVQQMSC